MQPTAMPSRSWKAAMLLLRLAADGLLAGDFRPARLTASSMCFLSLIALPTPMLTTIFSSRGSDMRIRAAELLRKRGQDLLLVALLQPRGRGRRRLVLLSLP